MACPCTDILPEDYDDYSVARTEISSDESSTIGSRSDNILNTTYEKATPLFRNIEKENWEGVLLFLNTSKWSNSIFSSSHEHMKEPSPSLQAKTWVTAYDRRGQAEWSQLPLHAAISYSAPLVVVQKLVEIFPKAVQCTDREGMLPIHLAFGFGAPDNVLSFLLETFPSSLDEKGVGGRLPHECCDLGPNKVRGRVYQMIADQTAFRVQEEYESDWNSFANAAVKRLGLQESTDLTDKQLTELLLELLQDRKELLDLKQKLSERLANGRKITNKESNGSRGSSQSKDPLEKRPYLPPKPANVEQVPTTTSRPSQYKMSGKSKR
jgi:hypothetical protein